MLLNKMNVLLVGVLCAVSSVFALSNIAQDIAGMNNMADKIGAAKRSLDGYTGGISAAWGVARSLTIAQTAARTAREDLAKRDEMTPEEGAQYTEAYNQMYPVLIDAIHSAKEKAPLFKKFGLGAQARTFVSNLHNEKRLFENQAKSKLPEDLFRKIQPSADLISREFDSADSAFQ